MPAPVTRRQQMAQRAYARVEDRRRSLGGKFSEYAAHAKSFPAMIHSSGLCQAAAFAVAKPKYELIIEDLAHVLNLPGITSGEALSRTARTLPVIDYMRQSRHAIDAAGWLKRYAESLDR